MKEHFSVIWTILCYKGLHYRLLHYSTKWNDWTKTQKKTVQTVCWGPTDDNLHLFYNMHKNKKNLDALSNNTYRTEELIGKSYTPQQHLLTLNFSNTSKYTRKLTLAIIQIILFEIWQSRNNSKYDKKLLPQHTFDTHQAVTCPKLTKINWLSI